MQKSLVIVESPAKAKTINQYLGSEYIVKSSIGHIRDLTKGKLCNKEKNKKFLNENFIEKTNENKILIKQMGIDPYQNWKFEYHILPGKEKIISELKYIANQVKHIYLATDLDREGEAIAWHLKEVIGGDSSKFSRVVFNEITQHSIQKAFKNVGHINMNRVHAQQARRFMDRIVGYMISPLLWKKIARGLSAGRVQSVAVRIIADRESIIKNFVPEEYWKLDVSLISQDKKKINMDVTHYNNKKFRPINENEVSFAVETIQKSSCIVKNYEEKISYLKAPAPFITSTLQQSASLRLGFSVKKTMFLAQKLYEEGYITYMRTDSNYLSEYAIKKVRKYIKSNYGSNYLPKEPNVYSNEKHSQEAHEAIRPSDIKIKNIDSDYLNSSAKKLYELIWNQFLASQMKSVKYKSITVTVLADMFKLQKSERIVMFQGWNKVLIEEKNVFSQFPILQTGSQLFINKVTPSQKFTKPPPRFSEASLVRELEKKGIGRPSTYSAITSKIQDRGYVKIKKNKFYAEKMGEILTIRLKKSFSNLIDYNFTAHMEKKLDQVAENKVTWRYLLDDFFKKFSEQLEQAKKSPEEGGMELNNIVPTSLNCPICCKKMGIKTAITGVFLSCLGYNNTDNKKRCKKTINLITLNDFNKEQDNQKKISLQLIQKCDICNMYMDSYFINEKLKLHICANNPSCSGYKFEKGVFKSPIYLSKTIQCEKCYNNMKLKIGPFGKFFICINKICKNTRKILPNGEISDPKLEPIPFPELLCKQSDAWFVLREGISGIFFAANTFPKSRETRSPFVEELVRFQHLLPEKIYYLSSAPVIDNYGNKTIVCFDKKKKTHYIASKKDGKFTGWSAVFIDQKWCVINK
ncbi:type I DNA topoisomerase [Buchnera aphidicola]|uniref:type I DNA topoisomerase n=1 Tax=Buchnera aphidicola TaxID=9 RepID=UPI000189C681|nr:type I DNA topoisomerase [Buchnera aphidicola]ACL30095.1 DNA topoisomerase I [Buchnera aphidicola str. Tuc7 (Acyrthosiphon pisum)]ADP66103.1 DNA topoisomerase I [Buchnera aphidicola str. LL01 (Acyrthosiphon pisum)]ADP66676.1 DNA topoisomerase I [Buchnera aphidicola str. TLW03 (Acyrthosiphon pisum)]ADP67258.1 DNA topoisomerase I [Buchnera aphidicola str. JF99 (Acyrthosiphon pisum)]